MTIEKGDTTGSGSELAQYSASVGRAPPVALRLANLIDR
jgi:hypothetical protein